MTIRLVTPAGRSSWPYWLCEDTGETADLQPLPYPRPCTSPEQEAVVKLLGGSHLKLTPFHDSAIFFDIREPLVRVASEYRSRLFWRRHVGAEVKL